MSAEDIASIWELTYKEVRALDLLLGCAPGDIVREKMRKQGLGQVDGEAAEEEEAARGEASVSV